MYIVWYDIWWYKGFRRIISKVCFEFYWFVVSFCNGKNYMCYLCEL